MLELTVLGSGTAVPTARRGSAGYLVRAGGRTVLLDLGSGTVRQLARAGCPVQDVGTVLVTHLHLDHVGDLAAFVWACRAAHRGADAPLRLVGPPGLAEHWTRLKHAHGTHLTKASFAVGVTEVLDGALEVEGLQVRALPVAHAEHTVGYRIEDPSGASLAFTADTDECDGLARLADRVGLWIAECSFPDEQYLAGHLTPARVARVARVARPRRIVLTHLYPVWDDRDPAAEVRRQWAGAVETAEDLGVWRIEAGG